MSSPTLYQARAASLPPAPNPLSDERPEASDARQWFKPGWPLAALFVGYPVWWALGLATIVSVAAAVWMGIDLLQHRRIQAPHNFGWWLLFLVWVVAGVAVLQVNAPDAVPGSSSTRYIVWAYRLSWYLAATIVLLYVGNTRGELSSRRIARILGWMFITVTVGGAVGVLAPHIAFPSLLELMLPRRITSPAFVQFLIHPTISQLYVVNEGFVNARPSAPFAYANVWGLNFACLLPFFIVGWCARGNGWRRVVGPVVLLIALVPVIYSQNRGLWMALVAGALFVAVRSALAGRIGLFIAVTASVVVFGGVVAASPLASVIQVRLDNPRSNEGRANLALQTVDSVWSKSPIVGLGTTRDVQGNFDSIAGGATAACPMCSPPALGTQGQLWLVIFSQGVVGLLFYLGFFTLQFLRHIRLRSGDATLALTVLVMQFVTLPVYDSMGLAMLPIMIAVGLLWRESRTLLQQAPATKPVTHAERPMLPRDSSDLSVRGYLRPFRRHTALIVTCMCTGAAFGGVWQYWRGTPVIASVSVLVPVEPSYPLGSARPLSLDTQAAFADEPALLAAVADAVGHPIEPGDTSLSVTATPNTRIVHFVYTGTSELTAKDAVTAAADTYLEQRANRLNARKEQTLKSIRLRSDAMAQGVRTVETASAVIEESGLQPRSSRSRPLQTIRQELFTNSITLGEQEQQVISEVVDAGHVVRPASAETARDGWPVPLTSGLVLGLLGGLLLSRLRGSPDRTEPRPINHAEHGFRSDAMRLQPGPAFRKGHADRASTFNTQGKHLERS